MKKFLIFVGGITLVAMALSAVIIVLTWAGMTKRYTHPIQELKSPDGSHTARLGKKMWIDLNYFILLDGNRIYTSPDFRPPRSTPYRETLLWDQSGRYLILEVAGRRLFGFDVENHKEINPQTLLSLPIPSISIHEVGFEGTWPENSMNETINLSE